MSNLMFLVRVWSHSLSIYYRHSMAASSGSLSVLQAVSTCEISFWGTSIPSDLCLGPNLFLSNMRLLGKVQFHLAFCLNSLSQLEGRKNLS